VGLLGRTHARPRGAVRALVPRVHPKPARAEPRREVRVLQECLLAPDAAHDLPQVDALDVAAVALRDAQVAARGVVDLQRGPHGPHQAGAARVVREAARVEPRHKVRVLQKGLVAPDVVHDLPQVDALDVAAVALRDAQVAARGVVGLQRGPHGLHQAGAVRVVREAYFTA